MADVHPKRKLPTSETSYILKKVKFNPQKKNSLLEFASIPAPPQQALTDEVGLEPLPSCKPFEQPKKTFIISPKKPRIVTFECLKNSLETQINFNKRKATFNRYATSDMVRKTLKKYFENTHLYSSSDTKEDTYQFECFYLRQNVERTITITLEMTSCPKGKELLIEDKNMLLDAVQDVTSCTLLHSFTVSVILKLL